MNDCSRVFIVPAVILMTLTGCVSLDDLSTADSEYSDVAAEQTADKLSELADDLEQMTTDSPYMLARTSMTRVDAFGQVSRQSGSQTADPFRRANSSQATDAYTARPLVRHIGDYVNNMAQDLVSNMAYVTERTPVAITTFSMVDSDLIETNILGHQMAQSFIHEFHKFRIPVVEFKNTQFIRVTEQGDFVLSRDFLELNNATPIQYVLTGTMTKHRGGFLINARLIGMKSNVVVASAQNFIPHYVVDALLPSDDKSGELVDGVRVVTSQ